MDIQFANKQFRRNVRGFYLWLGSLVAAAVLPLIGLQLIEMDTLASRIAGVVLATAGWIPMMFVIGWIIRASDEFQRRVHLVALGFAFGITMLLISATAWLTRAGFIDFPDLMVLWVISATAWVACMFVVKAYYERRP